MRTSETIDSIIRMYLSECSVSANSLKTYSTYLKCFYRYCDVLGVNKRELSLSSVIEVLRYVERSKSRNYYISMIVILKSYFKFLERKGFEDDLLRNLKVPRKKKTYNKEALTDQNVMKLLSIFTRRTFKEKRDYAMLMLMLVNGLRCVEISRIIQSDFIERKSMMCIYIQRKGHTEKDDLIQINEVYNAAIEDYMSDPLFIYDAKLPLFYNIRKHNALNREVISRIITAYMVKSGIKDKKITTHSLRHTAAVYAFSAGLDIYDVQRFLGHTKSEITEIYLHTLVHQMNIDNKPANAIMNKLNKLKVGQQSYNLLL